MGLDMFELSKGIHGIRQNDEKGEDWFNEMEFANEKFSKGNLKGLILKYSRKFLEIFMDPGIFSKKKCHC